VLASVICGRDLGRDGRRCRVRDGMGLNRYTRIGSVVCVLCSLSLHLAERCDAVDSRTDDVD
jgi:hypothetical protein